MSSLIESQHLMQTSECGIHLKLTLHSRNHFHHCAMTAATSAALECINKLPEASSEKYIDAHGLGLLCVQKKLSGTSENSTCLTKEALQFSKEDFCFVVKLCYKHM